MSQKHEFPRELHGEAQPPVALPPVVVIPEGENTASFPVTALPVASMRSVVITASGREGAASAFLIHPAA